MIEFYFAGVGVTAPGMPDWPMARQVLRGECRYAPDAMLQPAAAMLPANERRRAVASVRWALTAAQEAMSTSGYAAKDVATVFASSGGDGETLHALCVALASPEREVSPTRFHNSVHNAPAGYWSIAAAQRQASVSICGYDASFAAGLLEAASQVHVERAAVLLVAYDIPYPQPLHAVRPVTRAFAVALLLTEIPGRETLCRCRMRVESAAAADTRAPAAVGSALADNPAARAIPLLAMLASDQRDAVRLDYLGGRQLVIEPLS